MAGTHGEPPDSKDIVDPSGRRFKSRGRIDRNLPVCEGKDYSHAGCNIGGPTGEEMVEEKGIDSQAEFYGSSLPPLT